MRRNTEHTPLSISRRLPIDINIEFVKTIFKWKTIVKSPFGNSYYNAKVGWGLKPHGSLRIADHWNFTAKDKLHCETTTEVNNDTHWTIARFDSNLRKYIVLNSLKKSITSIHEDVDYRLLKLDLTKDFIIRHIKKKGMSPQEERDALNKCELKFMRKYLKIADVK